MIGNIDFGSKLGGGACTPTFGRISRNSRINPPDYNAELIVKGVFGALTSSPATCL